LAELAESAWQALESIREVAMSLDSQASHSGGCQCGAVRFRVTAPKRKAALCHCRMCQKAHAAPVITWLTVEADTFEWTRGEPASFRSSAKAVRTFCANCGTPLTFRLDGDATLDLAVAAFDRPQDFPPDRQYGIEARMPWLAETIDLPGKEAGPCADSFQHPDRDTAQWPLEARHG
jgi:hypothetical protein